MVYAIAEDADGRLWVSGNDGIVRINRGDGSMVRYGLSAGLQDLEFNGNAVAMLRDGQLAFGGIRGLNLIDPAAVQPSRSMRWPDLIGSGRRSPTGRMTQTEESR